MLRRTATKPYLIPHHVHWQCNDQQKLGQRTDPKCVIISFGTAATPPTRRGRGIARAALGWRSMERPAPQKCLCLSQIKSVYICDGNPPRTGRPNMRPRASIAPETGASLAEDRCVRISCAQRVLGIGQADIERLLTEVKKRKTAARLKGCPIA